MKNFYSMTIEETLSEVKSSKTGLSSKEAFDRFASNKNRIPIEVKHRSIFAKFAEQFKDLMILILLIASAVSIIIGIIEKTSGEIIDGCIILAIVIMNATFGILQENKAEKALDALKKMTEPEGVVLRDGQVCKVNNKTIVEGDIVLLEGGSIVPADLRLIETNSLSIDEASLTGESFAVEKHCEHIYSGQVSLAERKNMAFKGTTVTGGRGVGVVVGVHDQTEIGKIAKQIATTEKDMTPLQKSIKDIGKVLTFIVLAMAAATFVLEMIARPNQPLQAFLTAVTISVAAIPESMPAVITIIMSLGIARLAKQKAIVKRMHSVETLGCCDVICSDKTGTITQNKMSVMATYCDDALQEGKFNQTKSFSLFMAGMLLCNDTSLSRGKFVGDPTEIALSEFGIKLKYDKIKFSQDNKRLGELPFDSRRKLMSTLNNFQGQKIQFTKGAFDYLIKKCKYILIDGNVRPLSSVELEKIVAANKEMTSKALRVLGVAYKPCDNLKEDDLIFVGLVGMIDPPRKEIKKAVEKCLKAGMRPVMITGDHKDTAFAIAKQIGMVTNSSEVMCGEEIDRLSDKELTEKMSTVCVFARVSPENKVRIVETLKKQGHIVAMTGDGVNDAPSLKKANIGIGMGITGTDVTKEVADLIVTDDNFATIVVAVEEGRKIYSNIQKTVKFLFSANMGEILSLFIATILFPHNIFLFPVQILFINLITDSLPAIALGVEPPEKDLMKHKPRNAKKSMFAGGVGTSIVVLGLVQTLLTVLSYYIGLRFFGESVGVTMAFYTLNIIQMFYLASMRTNGAMIKSNPFKNLFFIASIVFCFGLIALLAFTPLGALLSLVPLTDMQWLIIFGLSVVMMLASELFKLFSYVMSKKSKNIKKRA